MESTSKTKLKESNTFKAVGNEVNNDKVIPNSEFNYKTLHSKEDKTKSQHDKKESSTNICAAKTFQHKSKIGTMHKNRSTEANSQYKRVLNCINKSRKGERNKLEDKIKNKQPSKSIDSHENNQSTKNFNLPKKHKVNKELHIQKECNTVKQKNKSTNPVLSKSKRFPRNGHISLELECKENDVQLSKKGIKPMSLNKLKELVTKCNNEVLLTITDKDSGFDLLLNQHIVIRDSMAYVLLGLGKAVKSCMTNNITAMILSITSNSNFFLVNLQQYLASFQMCKSEDYHLESLISLSEFLYEFQISFPLNAADVLLILLPLLKLTCDKYLIIGEKLYATVSCKLQEIEKQNKLVLEKYNANEIKQASQKEKLQLMNPPESYRSIPILPNTDDMSQACAFLRPNIVKGNYQDTEHYLDVQYRLLREDYVRPLRDGIAEYLKLKKQGKSVKHCKDVKVYENVHIVKQEFVNGGLVHMAHFKEKNFSTIKWELSKRFLTGSLLCLSSDDFTSMLYASIARREPKELKKGLLVLRFEAMTDEVLNINPLINFTVIETSAYFEAYRYNLNALLELNEATLPMKQYIIETQKVVQKPLYLNENTKYDMRPLLLPLNEKNKNVQINKLPSSNNFKTVNILDTNSWPSSNEINMNPSQLAALKAAVTKEFAVIQGPPGTGKTFVGLRIVQLLLHNIEKWQSDVHQLPILIVCQSNHALDQFLEGLLLFTKKLVRIGGRSTSNEILQYQLNNLKEIIKNKKKLPDYIFSNIKEKYFQYTIMKMDIDKILTSIQKSYNSVLSDNELRKCMSSAHYQSLKSMKQYLTDDGYLLNDWLGIRFRDDCSEKETLNFQNCQIKPPVTDIVIDYSDDTEEEADIDYIEAEREIISDEYNDVSYDLPMFENEDKWIPTFHDGLKSQEGERELKQYIKHSLEKTSAMLENDTKKIKNIWNLEPYQRWGLYKYWLESFIQEKMKESYKLQEELHKQYKQLCEMRTEEDVYVCKQAHVVGMTTTGAAKYRHIVQRLNPKILIVEEAAEILESHIVTSLAPGTQHVILIGDHQQLRPNPTVHLLAVKYDLNVSMFERMVENGIDCYTLDLQHRMRPEIAALITPYIYNNLNNHESVTKYKNIKGVSKNVFFITHTNNEQKEYGSKSKVNQHEAKFVVKLCKYFILQGYSSSQITVLTTYKGQLFEMKRLASQSNLQAVKFTVVDNYQGEENDIILISFVRSNVEGEIGFLKVANRVCVALSRAKSGLFCIGNFKLLAGKSSLWENIVHQLEKDTAIGPSLQLVCQNHPEVTSFVATEKDFDSVPEGGCTRKCEYSLSCGHVCSLMCHPYDEGHEKFQCQEPCIKYCVEGHLCVRKCYQYCGRCKYMVPKTMETCGHAIEVHCYLKSSDKPVCDQSCEKFLPCGHMCPSLCSKPCPINCFENVKVKSKVCGHKVIIKCSDSENVELLTENCREPCRVELSCGHVCKGTCRRCLQGRLHVECKQSCKRILVCGHECRSPCSKSCPPCTRPCENRCFHSKCPKKCGEPCKKCTEPCAWSCPHKKCSRLCGEPCDRTACDEPCPELLKCKHPCIGFCGEPCPVECRICNEKKVNEIFFGSENEIGARFVVLEDCKHIFELNGITQWMTDDIHEKREVQMKACPKCKVVIRRNLRFGNIVKLSLSVLEKVKRITCVVPKQNIQIQKALLQHLKTSGKLSRLRLFCEPLIRVLASGKTKSIQAITTMENNTNILLELLDVTQYGKMETLNPYMYDTSFQDAFTKLKNYVVKTKMWLTDFIKNSFLSASEQQLQELTWEVHRLKLVTKFLLLIQRSNKIQSSVPLDTLIESIMTYLPFRMENVKKFSSELEKLVLVIGAGAKLNVSEFEKKSILKAMGLSRGHWYQCPNGHVYCITECSSAMQVNKCTECVENIGGTQDTLLSPNQVAT